MKNMEVLLNSAYESAALPTELRQHEKCAFIGLFRCFLAVFLCLESVAGTNALLYDDSTLFSCCQEKGCNVFGTIL